MWRLVRRGLRGLLFAIGVLFLAWLPASFFFLWAVTFPFPQQGSSIDSSKGALTISVLEQADFAHRFRAQAMRIQVPGGYDWTRALWPRAHRNTGGWVETNVVIPLWLPALLCLAWPVTSFALARRKRRRGFPVEPVASTDPACP